MLVEFPKLYFLKLKIISVYDYLKNNFFILVMGIVFLALSLNCYYFFILYFFYVYFLYSKYKIIFRVFLFVSVVFGFSFFIYNHLYKVTEIEEIQGIVIEIKEKDSYNQILVKSYFKKYYVYDSDKSPYRLGAKILVKGENVKIKKNQIAMAFNYQEYLIHQKIVGVIKASSIKVLSNNLSILVVKEKVNEYINNNFDDENLMFLRAVILGDDTLITSEAQEGIRINGISHLFAISGLHIGLLIIIINYLLKKIKLEENKINLLISIFLFLYLIVTSFAASILRASLMWFLFFINKKYNLKLKSLDVVSIIFLILVCINPFYIYNSGFILSFLVTFTIVLLNPLIKDKSNVIQILYISIASQIVTLPIIINFNMEINIVSFLSNVLYINLFSIVLPISFLVLIFPFLNSIYNYLIVGFLKLVDFSSYINIGLKLPYFNINMTFVYYALIAFICVFYFNKTIRNYLSLLIILFVLAITNISSFNVSKEIYFFSLYNGEAILLTDSFNQANCLIDTGDGKNNEVSNYLKRRGIKKLDYLILTHNHLDHNGEAQEIINNFKVRNVVVSIYDESHFAYLNNTIKVQANDVLEKGNLRLEVLAPLIKSNDENDNSIVLRVFFGEYYFLFLADASSIVIEKIVNNNLKADIIKVAHHGSKTSLSYKALDILKPKVAIIQTGEIKHFGFPDKEVIASLNYYNIKIYRTDLDYSIKYQYLFNKSYFTKENL